jgi:Domain of unknown function (DUF3516)/DEAD/DEAH box helicase
MPALDPTLLADASSTDQILDHFLAYLGSAGLDLYDHQEEAILELFAGSHVILNTPTGSGKSLVALAVQFAAICQGRRCYYTVPVKALANEKFLSLCQTFGPERVGMITGDATVNAGAPVICCTAEILSNLALREGAEALVDDVIMDEFHYYSDHERGVAWQIPLLILKKARFLLMSATLGETSLFEKGLHELNGLPVRLVRSEQRPVPLEYEYSTIPLEEKIEELVAGGRAPIYLVHFTQLSCATTAQNLLSRNVCSREEKEAIAAELIEADFRSPYGKEVKKLLRHGLGIHHAGLLPKYRVLVERLAQKGLLKVICGTDTLGVGVNVPIRTVLFTQLYKYGGQKTMTLTARDFHQISGRAGRRGFDTVGYVMAQAPEHVIENLKAAQKAEEKGKKGFVKKTPPEKGFVMWDESTFQALIVAPPEKLSSSFTLHHGPLLQVLSRQHEDGCLALRRLIRDCHESAAGKKKLRRRSFSLFRGLVEGRVLGIIPKAQRTGPAKVALHVALQEDFSLNQALGLYLIEAITKLSSDDADYPLQVLSVIEAILEDPPSILRKQVDKAKTALMAEMKAEGVEYEDRIERLDEVEHPMPGREFIYATYNDFVLRNPWAKEASVRPKSIAREMFEQWQSFEDYVKSYGLERGEAVLLRHLSEVYKVLVQTVPPALRCDGLDEAETYLGTMLRGIDSSLLEEWEKMRQPGETATEREVFTNPGPRALSLHEASFTRLVRTKIFDVLKLLSQGQMDSVLELLSVAGDAPSWTKINLQECWTRYREGHGPLRFDPEARNGKHTHIRKQAEAGSGRRWIVEQVLVDDEESNDSSAVFVVDLDASDAAGQPVLGLASIGPIG